jgi:hypothetical protein
MYGHSGFSREIQLIRSLLLAATLLLVSVAGAQADGLLYKHNGSLVRLVWQGEDNEDFTVYYVRPKAGLPSYVRPGTVLLEGSSTANGHIGATAYVYSSKCGSASYEVSGAFAGNNFAVSGAAPVLNTNTCTDMGLSWNSSNARLHFTFLRED